MGFIGTMVFLYGLLSQSWFFIIMAVIIWVIDGLQRSNYENAARIGAINAQRRQRRLENIRFDLEKYSQYNNHAFQHNLAILLQHHDGDFDTLVYSPSRFGYEYDRNGYLVKIRY